MAKDGRLYVPIDVNWYDEWGHSVSAEAALLWVLALSACKRMRNDGVLTISQLRRIAPTGLTEGRVDQLVDELIGSRIAPISHPIECDDRTIVLDGWSEWNATSQSAEVASQSGGFGNHVRWHRNAGNPSADCRFCMSEQTSIGAIAPRVAPEVATRSLSREEKRREEKRTATTSPSFADDFESCWSHYPRKIAKKAALRAYTAQRRKGTSADLLLVAVRHYAEQMERESRPADRVLHGATFFGPDDRWEDFVKEPTREHVATGAGALHFDDYGDEMGEVVVLPGEARR